MRIFLTGATGFIGTAVIPELIAAGHQVLGLARTDAGASSITALGAQVHRGELTDLESLRSGAAASDGVIHCAFIHDFTKFVENCEIDRRAIETLSSALAGSGRPLVITSGTLVVSSPGRVATEDDPVTTTNPRAASEKLADSLAAQGVRVSVVRLPQVHDTTKQGLITRMIALARQKGVSAYLGDGLNRWSAVHRLDAAPVYRLALEKGTAAARYHAIAEEGVSQRDIAEAIGRGLNIPVVSKTPEEAAEHFGWLGNFIGVDSVVSSALTQKRLGWRPTATLPGMIEDLNNMRYSEA